MMTAILDSHIVSLITNIETLVQKTYGGMTTGQLYLVRQTLQRFFLGTSYPLDKKQSVVNVS
jgi:hypothetical protein